MVTTHFILHALVPCYTYFTIPFCSHVHKTSQLPLVLYWQAKTFWRYSRVDGQFQQWGIQSVLILWQISLSPTVSLSAYIQPEALASSVAAQHAVNTAECRTHLQQDNSLENKLLWLPIRHHHVQAGAAPAPKLTCLSLNGPQKPAELRVTSIPLLAQRQTNPACQVTWATEFCTVVPNIRGSLVWNLLHATLRWLLEFRKIFAPLA